MDALLNSLTEAESNLVRETKQSKLKELDEDGLVELHQRIRRARNKYVKLYRRAASAKVAEKGGRGLARPKNTRKAGKAEVFEDALARVSRRLAAAARASAADLKAERLAAAGKVGEGPGGAGRKAKGVGPGRVPAMQRSPDRKKRAASTQAKGARRQAKKDNR
jgi:hypothetical protein